jgi:hypothetical protein
MALLSRDVVILACAISAGIHGALAPGHFAEGMGAGAGFVVATVVLAVMATVLTRHPSSVAAHAVSAGVFAGLIGSYALATTTGLPVLHPEPERVEALALVTKAIEAAGAVAAASLVWRCLGGAQHVLRPKGTLT